MKQFKCSMAKKMESLAKKQESISGKYLMDPVQFEKDIREMIDSEKEDILKSVDDDEREYYEMAFETLGESDYDYAGELYKRLQNDMLKYVSGNDYRIMGNFNNIESDWNNDHEDGIKFQDLRKKLLDGVNDADTDEFSTWAIDWFFDTFGTYNMCYKYHDTVSNLAYSYQHKDEEDGDADESKRKGRCSMAKKIESLGKKNEKGTTKIETYEGFDELLGYADAEYLLEDVVDVLSKYYTYEDETFDEDQAKDDPEFTIKIEGGDERADFYSENIFYVHLPDKEAAEELAEVLGGNVSESCKRSEKRTVTKSYDVFTYDELSDEAKAKVKDMFLQWRGEGDNFFTENCKDALAEFFPTSDLKVQYSLSYSQGDGFNTYGKLDVDDLLNVDLSKYPLKDSKYITPLSDKDAIKAVCEKADVTSIELPVNHPYDYSLANRIEVVPDYGVELTDKETWLLGELEKFAQDVMGEINSKFESDGYDYFYEMSEEEVRDMADANGYEFTEDGELA